MEKGKLKWKKIEREKAGETIHIHFPLDQGAVLINRTLNHTRLDILSSSVLLCATISLAPFPLP
jgi:hypothetical protein